MQSIKCGGYNLLPRYFFLCCWLPSLKLIHKRNDYFLYSIPRVTRFQPSTMLSRGNSAPWELPPICYYISLSSARWSQNLINLTTILGFLCALVHGPTAQLTYSAYLSSQQIYLKFKKKQRGFWIIFLQKRGSKNWLQFKLGHWMLGTLGVNHGLDVFGYAVLANSVCMHTSCCCWISDLIASALRIFDKWTQDYLAHCGLYAYFVRIILILCLAHLLDLSAACFPCLETWKLNYYNNVV